MISNFADANKTGDTDNLMCWAAAASNMLWYSGWGSVANEVSRTNFQSEDDIFNYFKQYFSNERCCIMFGIQWFFTGIYLPDTNRMWYGSEVSTRIAPGGGGLIPSVSLEDKLFWFPADQFYQFYDKIHDSQDKNAMGADAFFTSGNRPFVHRIDQNDYYHALTIYDMYHYIDRSGQTSSVNPPYITEATSPNDLRYYNKIVFVDSDDGEKQLITKNIAWQNDVHSFWSDYLDSSNNRSAWFFNFTFLKAAPVVSTGGEE